MPDSMQDIELRIDMWRLAQWKRAIVRGVVRWNWITLNIELNRIEVPKDIRF
jgi:hypothetical protein